jgi:dTDP-4-amino-4,6-dideoxygalactose transaminase
MTYLPSEYSALNSDQVLNSLLSNVIASGSFNDLPKISFNRLFTIGNELDYIRTAIANGHISGDGEFTKKCQIWLENRIGCEDALITHSCTAALEMAAVLVDLQPGDEVIMPSYTFVSTANAFVLRGAVPVFVDVRPDTLNLDETKVEAAITPKTKAIVPVHYAGVSCEMDTIMAIAKRHNLFVIEDAAQGIMSDYKGRPIGSMGHLAALSFHETKNIVSGEGGAILINDDRLSERAEIIREKGTNRSKFFRGEVDKYTWVDVGSSYLPSDILSAFLWAQLEKADYILKRRLGIWQYYHSAFAEVEQRQLVRRPIIPEHCGHNAHIYYLLVHDLDTRTALIAHLKSKNIYTAFHYVPLHNSPAGLKYGRTAGRLDITEQLSDRLVRLPLGATMSFQEAQHVVAEILAFLG